MELKIILSNYLRTNNEYITNHYLFFIFNGTNFKFIIIGKIIIYKLFHFGLIHLRKQGIIRTIEILRITMSKILKDRRKKEV